MININWKITNITSNKNDGAVILAEWICYAKKDLNSEILGASREGVLEFVANPTSSNFIPFNEVQESDVLNWVWNKVDKADIENQLKTQLNNFNTNNTQEIIPWSN
jgi:hypothetical protein